MNNGKPAAPGGTCNTPATPGPVKRRRRADGKFTGEFGAAARKVLIERLKAAAASKR